PSVIDPPLLARRKRVARMVVAVEVRSRNQFEIPNLGYRVAKAIHKSIQAVRQITHKQRVPALRSAGHRRGDHVFVASSEWHRLAVDFKPEVVVLTVLQWKRKVQLQLAVFVRWVVECVVTREAR